MNIRTITVAAFAAVALAACNKPADTPAVVDSTATPANATPTVAPTDSAVKADSTAPAASTDSVTPTADAAKPVKAENPKP